MREPASMLIISEIAGAPVRASGCTGVSASVPEMLIHSLPLVSIGFNFHFFHFLHFLQLLSLSIFFFAIIHHLTQWVLGKLSLASVATAGWQTISLRTRTLAIHQIEIFLTSVITSLCLSPLFFNFSSFLPLHFPRPIALFSGRSMASSVAPAGPSTIPIAAG